MLVLHDTDSFSCIEFLQIRMSRCILHTLDIPHINIEQELQFMQINTKAWFVELCSKRATHGLNSLWNTRIFLLSEFKAGGWVMVSSVAQKVYMGIDYLKNC